MNGKVAIGRKRSMDPAQEHLREQKSLWNKSTTDLIAKIIAFKRGLNGRGDPRAGLPASNIKEPLPSQVGSYLDQIATDYSSLVSGAEKIIQEQEHYSKVRRKTQPKKPQTPAPVQPSGSEVEPPPIPLAADDGLVSEASWWGSQMWSRLFKLHGPKKKFVVDMMRSGRSFREKLLEAENYLTSSDPNSVPRALHIISSFAIGPYKTMVSNFENLSVASGKEFKEPEDPKLEEKSEVIVPPIPEAVQTVQQPPAQVAPEESAAPSPNERTTAILYKVRNELHKIISIVDYLLSPDVPVNNKPNPKQAQEMRKLRNILNRSVTLNGYIKAIADGVTLGDNEIKDIENIWRSYTLLTALASMLVGSVDNVNEIFQKINSTPKTAANPMLGFRKKWLKWKPDFLRDDVDIDMLKETALTHIDATLQALDELMNVLETTTEPDKILRPLQSFSDGLAQVFEDTINMGEYHNTHFRHEYRKDKTKGVVHMQILERELNKIRRAIPGVQALSSKILINLPTGINAFT